MIGMTRRRFAGGLGACVLAAPALANLSSVGIDYLERLAETAGASRPERYLAPSQVHEAYSHVIYANLSWSGDAAQKMWVLERSGSGWDVAMADEGLEGYSWPVSSGKLWPGNNRAGLTPEGVFNLDERSGRFRTGWGSPGMYRAVYIDLHYNSGRISGVAMHGTTQSMYGNLGRPDSHGCVRVTQANMDRVWGLLHPDGHSGDRSGIWGEVPRFFRSTPRDTLGVRTGYVRDGTLLYDDAGNLLTKQGYTALFVFFRDDI